MNKKSGVLFGEWSEIKTILDENNKHIVDYVVENDRRNSAIPMLDLKVLKLASSQVLLFVTMLKLVTTL